MTYNVFGGTLNLAQPTRWRVRRWSASALVVDNFWCRAGVDICRTLITPLNRLSSVIR